MSSSHGPLGLSVLGSTVACGTGMFADRELDCRCMESYGKIARISHAKLFADEVSAGATIPPTQIYSAAPSRSASNPLHRGRHRLRDRDHSFPILASRRSIPRLYSHCWNDAGCRGGITNGELPDGSERMFGMEHYFGVGD
jgi:hypothetical protein